ncbi:GNAT family N-acetyltransferase [Streptomyces sp. WMMB 322]|uniref:GNAT family N-acetyltransferase n=1 Tax=Streptomyces sp. WMMB 322 TaxID=1286821 RepID=UPI0034A0CCE1
MQPRRVPVEGAGPESGSPGSTGRTASTGSTARTGSTGTTASTGSTGSTKSTGESGKDASQEPGTADGEDGVPGARDRPSAHGTEDWPAAGPMTTARLLLEPLRADHAPEAFPVFDDERLHAWIGGSPYSAEELQARYRRHSAGRSPDGSQGWLNWMLRRSSDGQLVGTVQATLHRPAEGSLTAELAWVVGSDHQGNGYAREAAAAVRTWLRERDVGTFVAHIHPEHETSAAVARALGLTPTDTVVDGEIRWSGPGR